MIADPSARPRRRPSAHDLDAVAAQETVVQDICRVVVAFTALEETVQGLTRKVLLTNTEHWCSRTARRR